MYKISKQSYTTEFKQDMVRLVEVEGKSSTQVARDLGITDTKPQQLAKSQHRGQLASGAGKVITPNRWGFSRLPD